MRSWNGAEGKLFERAAAEVASAAVCAAVAALTGRQAGPYSAFKILLAISSNIQLQFESVMSWTLNPASINQ